MMTYPTSAGPQVLHLVDCNSIRTGSRIETLKVCLNSLVYIIRYANLSRRIRQTKLTRKVTLKYVHCHSFEMESVARSFAF